MQTHTYIYNLYVYNKAKQIFIKVQLLACLQNIDMICVEHSKQKRRVQIHKGTDLTFDVQVYHIIFRLFNIRQVAFCTCSHMYLATDVCIPTREYNCTTNMNIIFFGIIYAMHVHMTLRLINNKQCLQRFVHK